MPDNVILATHGLTSVYFLTQVGNFICDNGILKNVPASDISYLLLPCPMNIMFILTLPAPFSEKYDMLSKYK